MEQENINNISIVKIEGDGYDLTISSESLDILNSNSDKIEIIGANIEIKHIKRIKKYNNNRKNFQLIIEFNTYGTWVDQNLSKIKCKWCDSESVLFIKDKTLKAFICINSKCKKIDYLFNVKDELIDYIC